jgi:hypothetical protein
MGAFVPGGLEWILTLQNLCVISTEFMFLVSPCKSVYGAPRFMRLGVYKGVERHTLSP